MTQPIPEWINKAAIEIRETVLEATSFDSPECENKFTTIIAKHLPAPAPNDRLRKAANALVDYCIQNPKNVRDIPDDIWIEVNAALSDKTIEPHEVLICSACKAETPIGDWKNNTCPNCGTGMVFANKTIEGAVDTQRWHSLDERPLSNVPIIVERNCGTSPLPAYYSHDNYYCHATKAGLGDTVTRWKYPEANPTPSMQKVREALEYARDFAEFVDASAPCECDHACSCHSVFQHKVRTIDEALSLLSQCGEGDWLRDYLRGRRLAIESSLATERLAGNTWKEQCESMALAEITALEIELARAQGGGK